MAEREVVATFNDLAQADAARSVLESAGLLPELLDESTGGLHWGLLPALGGVRLQVPAEQAQAARDLLRREVGTEALRVDPGEEEAWAARRRRNRIVVLITFLLLLSPLLFLIFFA